MENVFWLGGSARERLEQSWAEGVRRKVLPLLLEAEDEFSGMYARLGRPNWSVTRMLGCLLMQEFDNKSDQALLDSLSFDIRYQHALGIAGDEAYLSRRSLVAFRSRLVEYDPSMRLVRDLFDQIRVAMCEELGVNTSEQRIDSTWVISNIRIRGRLGLFRQTVRQFMMWLEKTEPSQFERLSSGLRQWYRDFDDSWEQPSETRKHRPLILRLAHWAYEIEQTFVGHETITSQEPYCLVVRLLREQCIITKAADDNTNDGNTDNADGAQAKVEITVHEKMNKSDGAMRTPHDPDATTGMKGVGYHVQVTESCNNESCEVITDFEVAPAHIPDTGRATDVIERLDERGVHPEVLYADGGYPTPASLVESEELGTHLYAPVNRNRMPDTKMTRMDFTVDERDGSIISCPRGHAPALHTIRAATPTRTSPFALFDSAHCRSCPKLKNCPVQSPGKSHPNGKFRLEESRGLYLRDKTFVEQRSQEWRKEYRIRAGVEASMSELKRTHGLGRIRVRRRVRVNLSVTFKLMACNVKRWVNHVKNAVDTSPECVGQAA